MSLDLIRPTVSGCRVGNGGLHFGHLYGCMQGVAPNPLSSEYYFVISDCQNGYRQGKREGLDALLLDVLALADCCGGSVWMRVVRESSLRTILGPLLSLIVDVTPYRDLVGTHPLKDDIRSGTYSQSLGDLLFPVYQTSFMLGLNARWGAYNDDNAAYVNFARRTARKLNHRFGLTLPDDLELIARNPTRLRGYDGRRMAKSHGNHLPLGAGWPRVLLYADKLWDATLAGTPGADVGSFIRALQPFGVSDSQSVVSARELAQLIWAGLADFRDRRRDLQESWAAADSALFAHEESAVRQIRATLSLAGVVR